MQTKKIQCPRCGETDTVSYVEIRRVLTRRYNVRLQTDDYSSTLVVGPEAGNETIDSMTNEERLECSCGNRWDVPNVDDFDSEDEAAETSTEASAMADELRQRDGWDFDTEDAFIEQLDDLVHDIAANIASSHNNTGLEGQIEFVLTNLGKHDGRKAIIELLNDAD